MSSGQFKFAIKYKTVVKYITCGIYWKILKESQNGFMTSHDFQNGVKK